MNRIDELLQRAALVVALVLVLAFSAEHIYLAIRNDARPAFTVAPCDVRKP